ncbi:MAG TPA: winged helix-turn-helix domain-containing protein [Jiangellaceae bacterium]
MVGNISVVGGQVPVILGIALDDASRRRLTTELDDVGVLMFTPDVATAHAVLCRSTESEHEADDGPQGEPVVRLGELAIDRARCRVEWRGDPLALTNRERDMLAALAAEPSRVWTYQHLHAAAWDGGYLDPGPVHAAVKRLRRKLQDAGVPVRIDAVRGIGYQLIRSDERP